MKNKAEYKGSGAGISYASKDSRTALNQKGLTPDFKPSVKDKADSTTKSAVAEGTIHITDKEKQKQDIAKLNRDTKDTLNQLSEIFDKKKVEEKQELMGMIGKYGNQAIHRYAERKGWKDGSTEKILLHGAFGALMSDMTGGSARTGALSGGISEYVMGYLTKTKGEDWVQDHPDTVQWIGAGVGAVIGNLSDADMAESLDVALAATKWNKLAYERITSYRVKELLYKATGKQMTDKEIEGLLGDIVAMVKELDPKAAQSDYWEYGNTEAENAVIKGLKEHNISEENIEAFMDEYKKVYREAAREEIELFKKKTGMDLSEDLMNHSEKGKTFDLPSIIVTANRVHPLLEECEHSDMYEARRDLERNLEAELAESRWSMATKWALKSPGGALSIYSNLKNIGFTGAVVAEKTIDVPIAAKFLIYSIEGSGKPLSFEQGSDVSRNIEESDVLADKVKKLSKTLKPGEKKYFYSSMDFNGTNKYLPVPRDQQLAYGKVKLAIGIEKDIHGNIFYSGEVGDTYNFDWHDLSYSNYRDEHIKLIMNNVAEIYQVVGALQPFNWTASIKGKVQEG